MVLVFFVFPVILVVVAAVAAIVVVGRSSLRISDEGVEIRNYPQPAKVVDLARVDHFEPAPRVGNLSSLRPATAVLVLTDGTRVPVRTISSPDAGRGVDALNRRVASLRDGS